MSSRLTSKIATVAAAAVLIAACNGETSADSGADPEPDASPDYEAPEEPEGSDPLGEDAPADATAGRDLEGDLPPVDPLALEPLYGDALAELGVELTDRGGLLDRSDGYEVSADGTHLALYVSPLDERTDDEYLDGIVDLARVFLLDVFERWPALESFDVCQELPDDDVEDGYVPTVTQIDLPREVAETIDWPTVDLIDLLEADRTYDDTSVLILGELAQNERAVEAREEAVARHDARVRSGS